MQITKELLDGEIAGMNQRLENAKASLNQMSGALVVLQDLRKYLDREEPTSADNGQKNYVHEGQASRDPNYISPENAAIQARDTMSLEELAAAVAGEGASVEVVPVQAEEKEAFEKLVADTEVEAMETQPNKKSRRRNDGRYC